MRLASVPILPSIRLQIGKMRHYFFHQQALGIGPAFMVIEVDESPSETVRGHIRALPWVRWAFRLDKVAA